MSLLDEIKSLEKSKRRSKLSWFNELEPHKEALRTGLILGVRKKDMHELVKKQGIAVPYPILAKFLSELEKETSVSGVPMENVKSSMRRISRTIKPECFLP